MVCRATSGTNAPDLGMLLDMRYGISSACVRTRQVQRCRDAETDVRVDSAASRTLVVGPSWTFIGIRSIDSEQLHTFVLGVYDVKAMPRVHPDP